MRRSGTRSMPAIRSVVSGLVRDLGDSIYPLQLE